MRRWITGSIVMLFGLLVISLSAVGLEGPVLVFGGTSGTGLETIKLLRAQDISVTVFVRPTSNRAKLDPLGVSYVVGDALNENEVNAAFASDEFDGVVSSLGGRRGEPRPDLDGNRHITNAAIAAGVKRIIQVSSLGAGEGARRKPEKGAGFMQEVLHLKTLAEDHLIASGLDYTIVRPAGLRRDLPTGNGVFSEKAVTGSINRSDLGMLIVQCMEDTSTIGKVLHAHDPNLPGR